MSVHYSKLTLRLKCPSVDKSKFVISGYKLRLLHGAKYEYKNRLKKEHTFNNLMNSNYLPFKEKIISKYLRVLCKTRFFKKFNTKTNLINFIPTYLNHRRIKFSIIY